MADHHRSCHLLRFASFFLLLSFSIADDGTIMSKLSTAISPTPSSWNGKDFCTWEGIRCDMTTRVTAIILSSKSLKGTLPSDLNNLSNLKTVDFQHNLLSGELPTLANLTLLEEVILDDNNFTSIPSDFLLSLTNLQTFSISDNPNLSPWSLPYELHQSTMLQTFQANNANIIGSIPDIFDSFPNLVNLRLSHNNLTGTLPTSFGGSKIQNLWLNSQIQGLSGTIDVISSMTQLYQIWLHANAFTGAIPDLSKCLNLFDLQLRDNQLTGLAPDSLMSLPKLANISLHNNKLQGPLPVFESGVVYTIRSNSFCLPVPGNCDPQVTVLLEISGALGYPISLAEFWTGNDACANWFALTCDSENVTLVNFAKQKFSGTISPSFANLTSLRLIILKDNNLVGVIPEILTTLPDLQLLDVSNNNLSGPIPVFRQNVTVISTNNPFLGQITEPRGQSKGSSVSVGMVIGIAIGVLVFVGIVLSGSYKYYLIPSKSRNKTTGDQNEMPISESGNIMIAIEVLQQATDNFNDNNVLGRGGFGVVYKGELQDGTKIAVKRMKSDVMETKGMNEFQAEIGVLSKVRHRHLVALLGYCINGNERLLVFEYMPQGTLSQHLFKWKENKSPPLSWKQRVSIALDVGRGIEYLHSLAQQSFIHRDLKPDNILLDKDMRAKVADFGLVKIAPDEKKSIETRLAGTYGYLAPEYAATGRVTTKVDVYAFGVVLMEIITSRKALDRTMPDNEYHLVSWFRGVPITKENMVKFIDQDLDTDDELTLESIFKVAELAGHCTAPESFQRPNMSYVVHVLGPLVDQWKPSQRENERSYHCHHMSLPQDFQANDDTTSMLFNVVQPNSV